MSSVCSITQSHIIIIYLFIYLFLTHFLNRMNGQSVKVPINNPVEKGTVVSLKYHRSSSHNGIPLNPLHHKNESESWQSLCHKESQGFLITLGSSKHCRICYQRIPSNGISYSLSFFFTHIFFFLFNPKQNC
jgi:hypothetical protein